MSCISALLLQFNILIWQFQLSSLCELHRVPDGALLRFNAAHWRWWSVTVCTENPEQTFKSGWMILREVVVPRLFWLVHWFIPAPAGCLTAKNRRAKIVRLWLQTVGGEKSNCRLHGSSSLIFFCLFFFIYDISNCWLETATARNSGQNILPQKQKHSRTLSRISFEAINLVIFSALFSLWIFATVNLNSVTVAAAED